MKNENIFLLSSLLMTCICVEAITQGKKQSKKQTKSRSAEPALVVAYDTTTQNLDAADLFQPISFNTLPFITGWVYKLFKTITLLLQNRLLSYQCYSIIWADFFTYHAREAS